MNMSILRWLDLGPSQHLELEHGEDIDTVEAVTDGEDATEKRLLEQLKIRSGQSVTLGTVEALEALANYCVHRHLNPGTELLFRYLTNASIGFEKSWAGSQAGIATWQSIRNGEYSDEARAGATELFVCSLQDCPAFRKYQRSLGIAYRLPPLRKSLLFS